MTPAPRRPTPRGTPSAEPRSSRAAGWAGALRRHPALLGLLGISCAIEAVLWAAGLGWIGSTRWRVTALEYGAFWVGLLFNWQPNYPLQPWLMFFSYSLLHSGPLHLLGNTGTLLWLGPRLDERVGQRGLLAVWWVSVLGGAAAFGLMSRSASPMVGASGALFGLVGALVILNYRADRDLARVLWLSLGLVGLNLVSLVAEGGVLAWQTHLGGYLAGAALGTVLRDREIPEDTNATS